MDTTDRKGDVIITGENAVTNSRGREGSVVERVRESTRFKKGAHTQTYSELKLNRKTTVISINCTEIWNAVRNIKQNIICCLFGVFFVPLHIFFFFFSIIREK